MAEVPKSDYSKHETNQQNNKSRLKSSERLNVHSGYRSKCAAAHPTLYSPQTVWFRPLHITAHRITSRQLSGEEQAKSVNDANHKAYIQRVGTGAAVRGLTLRNAVIPVPAVLLL